MTQAHISNFLHGHRSMSMQALDKALAAIHVQVEDLAPQKREAPLGGAKDSVEVPLVSHSVAIFEPYMRASVVERMLSFPGDAVSELEARCPNTRRQWERFVAVRVDAEDARGMEPVLLPGAVVLLDRQYTSFKPFREGMPNLYAARLGTRLLIRYALHQAERVLLRPYLAQAEAHVVEVALGEMASDVLVGRVVLGVNEL